MSTNMGMTCIFVFAIFALWHCTHSLTTSLSGDTSRNGNYFHEEFPVPPAKYAMIEVDILIPRDQVPGTPLIMGIDTTKYDFETRCINRQYGQLANKNLFTALTTYLDLSGPLRCWDSEGFHCKGEISIQDYTPRNFSFLFGFSCYQRPWPSLYLHYNMTIHVTNKTSCSRLPAEHTCHRYMQFGALPNLRGQMFNYFEPLPSCLQLFQISIKILCYLFTHECDPESNQIIPACMEMCFDHVHVCDYHSGSWGHRKHINCGYLPSLNEEVPCFYEPITCGRPPPRVKHARLLTDVRHVRDSFLLLLSTAAMKGLK